MTYPARGGFLKALGTAWALRHLRDFSLIPGIKTTFALTNAQAQLAFATTIALGQAPQGVVYVPNAVPQGDGMQNLQPLGAAAKSV